jgi:hypothetical protein
MKTTNFSIGWCFIMEGSFEIADRFWMYGWYIHFFFRQKSSFCRAQTFHAASCTTPVDLPFWESVFTTPHLRDV